MQTPLRFMDEIDAGPHVNAWLEGLAETVRRSPDYADNPFWDVEYRRHEQCDGKTILVWWKRKLIGVAVCVRDELNFTVFQVCALDESTAERGCCPDPDITPSGSST